MRDELLPFVVIFGFAFALILSIHFFDTGNFEKTVYIVAVDKNTPLLGWKNTQITYTDIYPNAVTELDKNYITFYGTNYNIEAGKTYLIKYHKQWNWIYPIIDEVIPL